MGWGRIFNIGINERNFFFLYFNPILPTKLKLVRKHLQVEYFHTFSNYDTWEYGRATMGVEFYKGILTTIKYFLKKTDCDF